MTESADDSGPQAAFPYLREVRKQAHRTQAELGDDLGLSRWQVMRCERGELNLMQLAQVIPKWLGKCKKNPRAETSQRLYLDANLPLQVGPCDPCRGKIAKTAEESWGTCPHQTPAILHIPEDFTPEEFAELNHAIARIRLRRPHADLSAEASDE